jgi:hypothetical protein
MNRSLAVAGWVAAGLASGLAGGCASKSEKFPSPVSPVTIQLSHDRRVTQQRLFIYQGIHFVLPPPDVAATRWVILNDQERVLRQLTPFQPAAKGPAGSIEVSFQAIHGGRSLVAFGAIAPGAQISKPTDFYEIFVTVAGIAPNTVPTNP